MDLQLTEEVWESTYLPRANTIDDNASWNGWMYETYGAELEYVQQQDVHHVWTLVEVDGWEYIVNGLAYVNRMGYFVCEVPWEDGQTIEFRVDEEVCPTCNFPDWWADNDCQDCGCEVLA